MKNTTKAIAAMILMIGLTAPALADAVNEDDVDNTSWGQLVLADALMLGPGPIGTIIQTHGRPISGRAFSYCIVNCSALDQGGDLNIFQDSTIGNHNDGGSLVRLHPSLLP